MRFSEFNVKLLMYGIDEFCCFFFFIKIMLNVQCLIYSLYVFTFIFLLYCTTLHHNYLQPYQDSEFNEPNAFDSRVLLKI